MAEQQRQLPDYMQMPVVVHHPPDDIPGPELIPQGENHETLVIQNRVENDIPVMKRNYGDKEFNSFVVVSFINGTTGKISREKLATQSGQGVFLSLARDEREIDDKETFRSNSLEKLMVKINAKNKSGQTALELAAITNKVSVIRLIAHVFYGYIKETYEKVFSDEVVSGNWATDFLHSFIPPKGNVIVHHKVRLQ